VRCGPSYSIDVPLDLQRTFWQPSGNQQPPAQGGLALLGPAIVLNPSHGLPTGQTCTIVFSEQVTDKAGNPVCAPKWGADGAPDEVQWPPTVDCVAGDTTDITFTVEELRVTGSSPSENQMNFPRVKSGQTFAEMRISFNAEISLASFEDATLVPAPAQPIQVVPSPMDTKSVLLQVPGGLAPQTDYTLTIPAPTDYYGIPYGVPYVRHFRTGN
jgi:hypothetical protein